MDIIGNFKLFEGGNALKFSRDILRSEVEPTLSDFLEESASLLGLSQNDFVRIGSAGEAEASADIDLCVLNIDLKTLHERVRDKLGHFESRVMPGVGVVSVGYPIANDPHGYVQLDLIPVVNRDWCDFIFGRPVGSKYKSAHRNWLISSILSCLRDNLSEDVYRGYSLRLGAGVYLVEKSYVGKTKRLKNPIKIKEEFFTAEPYELMRLVFGPTITMSDVSTFEGAYEAVCSESFRWPDIRPNIMDECVSRLKKAGLILPEELKQI